MQPTEELASTKVQGGSALTIGVFDGVHIGHRYLLEQVKASARRRGLASAVITFRNHPRTVLAPGEPVAYICSLTERLELLRTTGVDHVVPLTFTKELSQYSPRQFVELLTSCLGMKGLLVGPDFALGKGRAGTAAVLEELGRDLGYTVATVLPFDHQGQVVSATAIRRCLAAGDMELAATFLGRPPSLSGPVVVGDRRGRSLGFPTANIGVAPDIVLPADGIYCTVATAGGRSYDSVSSIGVRPTFGESLRTVETYIMDFSDDLYGQHLKIDLLKRLRDEKRFSGVDELVAQMKLDVETAREVLAGRGAA